MTHSTGPADHWQASCGTASLPSDALANALKIDLPIPWSDGHFSTGLNLDEIPWGFWGVVGFCVKTKAEKMRGWLGNGGKVFFCVLSWNYMGVSANVPTIFFKGQHSIWEIFCTLGRLSRIEQVGILRKVPQCFCSQNTFCTSAGVLRQPPLSQQPLSTARWWEDGMKRALISWLRGPHPPMPTSTRKSKALLRDSQMIMNGLSGHLEGVPLDPHDEKSACEALSPAPWWGLSVGRGEWGRAIFWDFFVLKQHENPRVVLGRFFLWDYGLILSSDMGNSSMLL